MKQLALILALLLGACQEPRHEVSVETVSAGDPGVSRKVSVEVPPEGAAAVKAEIKASSAAGAPAS
jgi:hypothetical protein